MPTSSSPPPANPGSFYRRALSRAERLRLSDARSVQGLDEEIALLRLRIATLAQEHPENLDLFLKSVSILTRAVATRYKLSPRSQDDLYQSILGVLQGVGSAILPEDHDGL